MKPLILLLSLSLCAITSYSQRAEFTIYPNGLLYNDTTISRLRSIADSLQQHFDGSPLGRDYYAFRQGRGHYIRMTTGDVEAAVADIRQGIGYEDFVRKYAAAKVDYFVLATERDVKDDYHHLTIAEYTDELYDGPVNDAYFRISYNVHGEIAAESGEKAGENGKWVFHTTYPPGHSTEELRAFYFLQPLSSPKLPDASARLIFYTDYMIDTTAGIYYKDAWDDGPLFDQKRPAIGPAQALFRAYIRDSLPRFPEFQRLLSQAVPEVVSQKSFTDDVLEDFTAKYYSSSAALAMKRNRRITYMDNFDIEVRGPIVDMNIAILAAKSVNWPVFLKAHLQFMGYNYRGQVNGIKELEAIDIRVPDLLLGIGLQTIHPAQNHPWGSISKLGKDLVEVSDKQTAERAILATIRDPALDDYNRLRMHYLFLNYLFFLPDKENRLAGLRVLEDADKMLPVYLAAKVKTDPSVIERGNMASDFPSEFEFSWPYRPWKSRPDLYGTTIH